MRILAFAVLGLALSGCTTTSSAPNFINGQYYMTGDANCARAGSISPTRINCFTQDGQLTGYRDAMTTQQIQMYQFQVMQNQIQIQQMQQSLAYNNAIMAANTQATLNAAAIYSPPAIQPLQMPGGNQIRCIGVGIYANCRW